MAEGDLEIHPRLTIPEAELVELASRSSGPGGQHVNKASTRVTLRWNVVRSRALTAGDRALLLEALAARLSSDGELIVHADRSRSRTRNREDALERMREIVGTALLRPRDRHATKPTRASRQRRLAGKKKQTERKALRRRPTHDD